MICSVSSHHEGMFLSAKSLLMGNTFKSFVVCWNHFHPSSPSETHTHMQTSTLSCGRLKYKAFRWGREVEKKASSRNGKMSVVPINNLGFSVRQLWGVLWIPSMGPSLLPAVELPGKLTTLCVCLRVFVFPVCLLSIQRHKVSRVTTALGVRMEMRLEM